jgi:hypothetical protein
MPWGRNNITSEGEVGANKSTLDEQFETEYTKALSVAKAQVGK